MTLTPPSSGEAFDLGVAECVEAVHECDADVDFGSLSVRVSRGDPFTEGFETAHSRLDPASGMIAGSLLPVRPTEAPGRPEDVVAGTGRRAVFLPEASVLADRDNGGAAAIQDGRVATPGV